MQNELRLEHRHVVLLFIAGVVLCVIFFCFGLFVGRLSTGHSIAAGIPARPESWLAEASEDPTSDSPDSTSQVGAQGSLSPEGDQGTAEGSGLITPGHPGSGSTSSDLQPTSVGPASESTNGDEPKAFYVQAAEYDSLNQAESFAAILRSREFLSAHVKSERSTRGQRTHYVLLGPYVDRDTAQAQMTKLRNSGVSDVRVVVER